MSDEPGSSDDRSVTEDRSVLLAVQDGVATVTINRPTARNAMNMAVKRQLAEAFTEVRERDDIRALILTGAEGSFCAGGDIGEMALNTNPLTSRARLARLLDEVVISLAELEKPTIAAIEGHAHGAGLSLGLACDLMVVAEDAQLSCAFAALGLVPDCGALYFLPRRLPIHIAKELVFTGRRFSGAEAHTLGLANRVTPAGEALGVAEELAGSLAGAATAALGMAKRLLDVSTTTSLRELSQLEAFAQAVAYTTEDHLAARAAFKTRTKAAFVGH